MAVSTHVRALHLYRTLSLGARLHTVIRARTCPMADVLARVPNEGRLLEVGCGHGLFANEAALRSPDLFVVGIDPAPSKILWAKATVGSRTNVVFRHCRVEELRERRFDVVAILDVLYLVPRSSWVSFLRECRKRLQPGGRLILKEVNTRPRWKFSWCLAQEIFSVRLLNITLGHELAFATPDEMVGVLHQAGFQDVIVTSLGASYITPHILYEAKSAPDAS